jgi:hypothetical protein
MAEVGGGPNLRATVTTADDLRERRNLPEVVAPAHLQVRGPDRRALFSRSGAPTPGSFRANVCDDEPGMRAPLDPEKMSSLPEGQMSVGLPVEEKPGRA